MPHPSNPSRHVQTEHSYLAEKKAKQEKAKATPPKQKVGIPNKTGPSANNKLVANLRKKIKVLENKNKNKIADLRHKLPPKQELGPQWSTGQQISYYWPIPPPNPYLPPSYGHFYPQPPPQQ